MSNTDQEKMDEVLARMLKTPPKPHKPAKSARANPIGKLGKVKQVT